MTQRAHRVPPAVDAIAYDYGYKAGRAQGRLTLKMVRRVYKESMADKGINLIAFTHKLNALLSAPPAETKEGG